MSGVTVATQSATVLLAKKKLKKMHRCCKSRLVGGFSLGLSLDFAQLLNSFFTCAKYIEIEVHKQVLMMQD